MRPPNKKAAGPGGQRGEEKTNGTARLTAFHSRRKQRRFVPSRLSRITCAWGPTRRFRIW
jgi:hypothetical protein